MYVQTCDNIPVHILSSDKRESLFECPENILLAQKNTDGKKDGSHFSFGHFRKINVSFANEFSNRLRIMILPMTARNLGL